jgi:hypothetical protein
MSLFKDFGKATKDLLTKGFKSDEHKVEVKSSHENGSFESIWSSTSKSSVKTEINVCPKRLSAEVECESDGKVSTTVKYIQKQTVFKVKGTTVPNLVVSAEHTRDKSTATAEVDHTLGGRTLINLSALYAKKWYLVGGNASLSAENEIKLKEFTLGAGVLKDRTEVNAFLSQNVEKNAPPNAIFQFLHRVNPVFTYAARFSRSIEPSAKCTTELGGNYVISDNTTLGAKITNTAQVDITAKHDFNSFVSFTQSFGLNIAQPSVPYQYGFSIKMKR